LVDSLCDSGANRFVLKATVFPSKGSSGFVGYGDADPFNVSPLVRGAEMRVAETRAVNRALRKAYGIGICSVEEIGTIPNPVEKLPPQKANGNALSLESNLLCRVVGLQTPSGETQFTLGHRCAVDRSHCFHQREIFNKLEDLYLNFHSVSWDHWHQESHLIDGAQHKELSWLHSRSGRL
jgi:hypothetical protein